MRECVCVCVCVCVWSIYLVSSCPLTAGADKRTEFSQSQTLSQPLHTGTDMKSQLKVNNK